MQYILPPDSGEARFANHVVSQVRLRTALVIAGSGGATQAAVEREARSADGLVEGAYDRIRKGVTLLVASLTPLS